MDGPLFELFYRCTARIQVLSGGGTGFFVAPGLILTCAHVVESAKSDISRVKLQYGKNEFRVQSIQFRDKPYPDLALLTIDLRDHPCVYLDAEVQPFDEFLAFSRTGDYRGGISTTVKYEGRAGFDDKSLLLRFKAGKIIGGYSGSPLLNRRTGGVCGVVKTTRDDTNDAGGSGIPCAVVLREFPELVALQVTFHAQNKEWQKTHQQSATTKFQPTAKEAHNLQPLVLAYRKALLQEFSVYDRYDELDNLIPLTIQSDTLVPTSSPGQSIPDIEALKKLRERTNPGYSPQPPSDAIAPGMTRTEVNIEQFLAKNKRVVLLGAPGAGKSTTLRHLFKKFSDQFIAPESSLAPSSLIPIFAALNRWTDPGTDLMTFLKAEIARHNSAALAADLPELMQVGRIVLLLDGLNELPPLPKPENREKPKHPRHSIDQTEKEKIVDPRVRAIAELGKQKEWEGV